MFFLEVRVSFFWLVASLRLLHRCMHPSTSTTLKVGQGVVNGRFFNPHADPEAGQVTNLRGIVGELGCTDELVLFKNLGTVVKYLL